MTFAEASAAVSQFPSLAASPRAEAIACWMVVHDCSVTHAAWELYGRPKGLPCRCVPCTEVASGREVVLRILVQGRAFGEELRA